MNGGGSMKKFISVVLVFSLIFVNMSFPVGAIFNSENETEFAGIIQLDGEKYAYQADDNTTLMLGRLDIDILNDIEFQNAMNRNDIPTDVKVVLKERREKVMQSGITSKIVTIFSPDFVDESGIVPFSNSDEKYYDYQGHPMKSVYFYEKGIDTTWQTVEEGTKAYPLAKMLHSVVLTSAGFSPIVEVQFFAAGISLAEAFMNAHPSAVVHGSKDDVLQIRYSYDHIEQWTYGNLGGKWTLGLITHRSTINEIGRFQYYYDSEAGRGSHESGDEGVYEVYKSEHYSDPWATAWRNIGYDAPNESLALKVGNKVFALD